VELQLDLEKAESGKDPELEKAALNVQRAELFIRPRGDAGQAGRPNFGGLVLGSIEDDVCK